MARTFVRVELEHPEIERAFAKEMTELGFLQTVTGKKKRNALRLPSGMYLIERAGAAQALELTRQAARKTNVRARIFCVPVGGDVRFAELKAA